MAYVNGTTHYNLPQTVGTDKRDWADTNQAFADVDAALYSATEDVADAQTEINSLKGRMDTAETNITTNTSDIAALDTRLTTAEGAITAQGSQISDVKQDTEDMICAYNEASATSTHVYEIGDYFIYNDVLYRATQQIAISDTIVPDTNCTTTNITTELLTTEDLSGDVEQLQTDVGQLQTDVGELQTDVTGLKQHLIHTIPGSGYSTLNVALGAAADWINANVAASDIYRVVVNIGGNALRVTRYTNVHMGLGGIRSLVNGEQVQIISEMYDRSISSQIHSQVIKFDITTGTTSYVLAGAEAYDGDDILIYLE